MTRYSEKRFGTKSYPYKVTFFKKYTKSVISKKKKKKKKNAGTRFLIERLASYDQKNKFESMRLMKL